MASINFEKVNTDNTVWSIWYFPFQKWGNPKTRGDFKIKAKTCGACHNPICISKESCCFIELQKLLTGGNEILLYWDKAINWRRGQLRVFVVNISRGEAHLLINVCLASLGLNSFPWNYSIWVQTAIFSSLMRSLGQLVAWSSVKSIRG